MKLRTALATVALLALSACGSPSDNHDIRKEEKTVPADAPTAPSPKDEPAAENRYDVFISQMDCSTKTKFLKQLFSENLVIAQDERGRDILVQIAIQLNGDHSYEARYVEHHVSEYMNASKSGFYYSDKNDQVALKQGRWVVNRNNQLVLEGLGQGFYMTYNQTPAISFTFDVELLTPGLNGKTTIIRNGYGRRDNVHDTYPCD